MRSTTTSECSIPIVVRALQPQALQELAHVFPLLSGFADETSAPRGQADRYRFHYAVRAGAGAARHPPARRDRAR